MAEKLVFADIARIEVEVEIQGKPYILREANGDVHCKFRNALSKCARLGPDGNLQGITGDIADLMPMLVSLCLFEANGDGQFTKNVPVGIVRSWPMHVLKPLFLKAKEIGGFDEADEDEPKNSPSATTDGSG